MSDDIVERKAGRLLVNLNDGIEQGFLMKELIVTLLLYTHFHAFTSGAVNAFSGKQFFLM